MATVWRESLDVEQRLKDATGFLADVAPAILERVIPLIESAR